MSERMYLLTETELREALRDCATHDAQWEKRVQINMDTLTPLSPDTITLPRERLRLVIAAAYISNTPYCTHPSTVEAYADSILSKLDKEVRHE